MNPTAILDYEEWFEVYEDELEGLSDEEISQEYEEYISDKTAQVEDFVKDSRIDAVIWGSG